jgi:hypothetical protein
MAVKPITPNEASKAKATSIPDEVFEAFNELIAEKLDGNSATVLQKDVVARIILKIRHNDRSRSENAIRNQIYEYGWLDVEPAYRRAGWKVEYDKPGYCETYEASFEFRKPRTR